MGSASLAPGREIKYTSLLSLRSNVLERSCHLFAEPAKQCALELAEGGSSWPCGCALELAEGVLSGGCVRRGCAGNPPGKI